MQLLMGRPLRRQTPLHGGPLWLLPVWWVGLRRAAMRRPLGLVQRVQLVVTEQPLVVLPCQPGRLGVLLLWQRLVLLLLRLLPCARRVVGRSQALQHGLHLLRPPVVCTVN
jgi:hypothetical protein